MKRKSIFITGLMVLMALLVFVGCEQASFNFPKYVVSADVRQTQDFLVGQAFDPSKFEVTVYYSDGSSSVLEGQNISTGNTECKLGMTASVNAGLNKDGSAYNKPFAVSVYEATGLKVTAPASVTVNEAGANVDLDASLFTVIATYKNGEITLLPNADYTVNVDTTAMAGNTTATKKAEIVSPVFDVVTTDVSVTYEVAATPAPEYDYETFVWNNNALAFSVADSNAFERSAFDADNVTLYRVYTGSTSASDLSMGYYLVPVDNADVIYGFADSPTADTEAETYPAYVASAGETAQIYFDYSFIAEDETTGLLSHVDESNLLMKVDPSKFTADEEGRLIPTGTGCYDSATKAIKINIRQDYVTGIEAEVTKDKGALYVGETVQSLWLDVTATYASGYTAEGGNKLGEDDFEVTPNVALKLGDKITIKVTDTYGKNAALYGKTATFDTDLEVLDYIVSFETVANANLGTVYSGQILDTSDFTYSDFVMASGAKTATAPAGTTYAMYNTYFTESQISNGQANFWVVAKFNGKEVTSAPITVKAETDYPTGTGFDVKLQGTATVGSAFATTNFNITVTSWMSGNDYKTIEAPNTVTYAFEGGAPVIAEGANTISNLKWTCGTHSGIVPAFQVTVETETP